MFEREPGRMREHLAEYPNRTEFYADEHGRFDEEMRTELASELERLLRSDAYLYAELNGDDGPYGCVWHVIENFMFPVTATHATALMERYPALMPSESTINETEDAPDLSLIDE